MGKLAILISIFLLIACATTTDNLKGNAVLPDHQYIKSNSFKIGKLQQKKVGECMIKNVDAVIQTYDAFNTPTGFILPSFVGIKYPRVPANTRWTIIFKLDNGDYVLQNKLKINVSGRWVDWDHCVLADSFGRPYGYTNCSTLNYVAEWNEDLNISLIPEQITEYLEGSLKQEFIYKGKLKDMIQLQYREYKGGHARAYYQDLSYDLTESNIIDYRGMKIAVVEATDSHIKYIVHSKLSD